MNKLLILPSLLLFGYVGCFAQESGSATSAILKAPDDWSQESFALPPTFVTDLDVVGVEEVRFAPGWADPASTQFWTYTFAWYLDGDAKLTEQRLEKLMEEYFTGLTQSVGSQNGIEKDKIIKANAQFTATATSADQPTFEGTVALFDVFFTQRLITLNAKVEVTHCSELDKQLILFSFSPQAFANEVWEVFNAVQSPKDCQVLQQATLTSYTTHQTDDYELLIPKAKQTGVLLLFPGFPETPDVVKREFKIVAPAMEAGVAVALMKFNRKLWLEEDEKVKLAATINQMFEENELEKENVSIGGFSSGGTISLLISDYLVASESSVQPEGVFVIDSPVDLLGLYENSQRNIQRNFSSVSVQESQMIVSMLESAFGKPEAGIAAYEVHAVYTGKTHNTKNVSHLKDIELRFYTEPDTVWWKQNRQNDYEDMNAYFIKQLTDDLAKEFGDNVTYIPTENRGYRANGDRHPHSWSIVEVDDLMRWMTVE